MTDGGGVMTIRGFVKSCGGDMDVRNIPGTGSVFDVCLPAIERKNMVTDHKTNTPPSNVGRVFFIDDEPALVNLQEQMLKRLGYDVVVTCSSIQALDLFKQDATGFDLAVIDMTMPFMNGMELAGEFLKIRPALPIILCTGYLTVDVEKEAAAIGIRKCLTKPFSFLDLSDAVRAVLHDLPVNTKKERNL